MSSNQQEEQNKPTNQQEEQTKPVTEQKHQKKTPEQRKLEKENAAKKRKEEKERRRREKEQKRQQEAKALIVHLTWKQIDEGALFGHYPRIQSSRINSVEFTSIEQLTKSMKGKTVTVRARVHSVTGKKKTTFLILRDQYYTIQACVFADKNTPKDIIKYSASLTKESIVDVVGVVNEAPTPIRACTQQDVELQVQKIFCVVEAKSPLPLLVEDAMISDDAEDAKKKQSKPVGQDVRLDNRVLDMRAPAHIAIFKIQSAVGQFFREFLYKRKFVEIHTPKLIATASEGGADVFEVKYFNRKAYLAQSPQLYKQMAVQGDLKNVFEIGPVFRAEKSFTHRHLTEFVGLDLEMEIKSHYIEVLELLHELFVYMFDNIKEKYSEELKVISQQYPFQPLQYTKKMVKISYPEAIKMLNEDGIKIGDLDDIDTPTEKRLGVLVKQKFGTDFYILDRFPLRCRPFYTMPAEDDKNYSNSYDLFIRGEEIISGAQRIHDPDLLEERAKALNVNLKPIQAYVDSFKYGAWPHGGAGIGLERVAMLYLGMGNVRRTSMFPRDPDRLTP